MNFNIRHAETVDIVGMLSTRRRLVCGVVIKSSWRDFSSGRSARACEASQRPGSIVASQRTKGINTMRESRAVCNQYPTVNQVERTSHTKWPTARHA